LQRSFLALIGIHIHILSVYNKHCNSVVCISPCAIVEKPHEKALVLKDKSWLGGILSCNKSVFLSFFPPFWRNSSFPLDKVTAHEFCLNGPRH